MNTTRRRHLVDVWNPSYASDAMTAHLTVLLESAQRSKGTDTDPYVWWGKMRLRNRQQALKHLPQILELRLEIQQLADDMLTWFRDDQEWWQRYPGW